jgi:hypothetical protein
MVQLRARYGEISASDDYSRLHLAPQPQPDAMPIGMANHATFLDLGLPSHDNHDRAPAPPPPSPSKRVVLRRSSSTTLVDCLAPQTLVKIDTENPYWNEDPYWNGFQAGAPGCLGRCGAAGAPAAAIAAARPQLGADPI